MLGLIVIGIGFGQELLLEQEQKLKDMFLSEQYEQGVEYLKELQANSNRAIHQRYLSMFYSYLIKQTFEAKKIMKAVDIISKAKKLNNLILKKDPDNPAALVGMGEHYQYMPGILGGSDSKAKKYFLRALGNRGGSYAAYKTLIFFLNKVGDFEMAKEIFDRIQKGEFKKEPLFEDFYQVSVIYQEGVRLYRQKEFLRSKETLEQYLTLHPSNYWAHYMLWKAKKALGEDGGGLWEKAYSLAEAKGNQVFLDTLKKDRK